MALHCLYYGCLPCLTNRDGAVYDSYGIVLCRIRTRPDKVENKKEAMPSEPPKTSRPWAEPPLEVSAIDSSESRGQEGLLLHPAAAVEKSAQRIGQGRLGSFRKIAPDRSDTSWGETVALGRFRQVPRIHAMEFGS